MHQRLASTEHMRLRSVLRKPGHSKKQRGRSVTFNESLNLFYEAECSCWIHEDEYAQMRQEEHERRERVVATTTSTTSTEEIFHYEPIPPIEFEDTPTLSPPEGYKDRFFPQEFPTDPDVTRVSPPSPPAARRKVFLKGNPTAVNGQDEDDDGDDLKRSKSSRISGILKGGRLWRSNSAEGKKVSTPPDEPDVVKCSEPSSISGGHVDQAPLKVSTGTAPLRTSEQIRLAVDSTLRSRAKKKPECSSLVEKLRWLTSLDDDDSSDSNASGFATWPSREKNGTIKSSSGAAKTDAGTSTSDEFVPAATMRQPPINSASEAKIKQISYTLEDIDEGLKSGENELESFVSEDVGRIERIRKRYGDDVSGDDYGFSRRPSVKGIKPKFSSTNQIFAQFTMRPSETPIPTMESTYENTRVPAGMDTNSIGGGTSQGGNVVILNNTAARINYEFANAPGRQTDESRAHFEMIRQSFEPGQIPSAVAFNRPHSWSVSTLPHPHHHSHSHSMNLMAGATAGVPAGTVAQQINNFGGSTGPGGGGNGGPISNSNHYGPIGQPMGNQAQANLINKQQLMQQQQPQLQPGQVVANTVLPPEGSPMPMGMANLSQNLYSTLPHNAGGNPTGIYGTLPHPHQMHTANPAQNGQQFQTAAGVAAGMGLTGGMMPSTSVAQQQQQQQQQQMYGTVRRVPNVIGRPLFLHYGALSVEAHPNKIVHPRSKVPETPSPTQQPPPIRYYGPPIRYYNPPPPVPPRTAGTTLSSIAANNTNNPHNTDANSSAPPDVSKVSMASNTSSISAPGTNNNNNNVADYERGVPEGANDDEPAPKEAYSMNV